MNRNQEEEHSRFKIAQLWHFVSGTFDHSRNPYFHNSVINEILNDNFDINAKVTIDPHIQESKIHLEDCTALHFVYCDFRDIDTFSTLLKRGADFTIKNGNGQTALHLIITNFEGIKQGGIRFINAVLAAHVEYQNFSNPCDDNGISHLHGACIANHVEATRLFLENGAVVDGAVNVNAFRFSGYTPLHFAAAFGSFKVIPILLSNGSNVNACTADGKSAIDLLIECKTQNSALQEKEQTIKLLLEKGAISVAGLLNLHVASTLKDLTIAEKLFDEVANIDFALPIDSPIRPGDTVLHFAADNSIEAVKMLLTRGAKLEVMNVKGLTPLDACINNYSLHDVCDILLLTGNWKEIQLSDGQTKLLDLMVAMRSLEDFKLFLQNKIKDTTAVVPSDCVLWPGYTILHLAVAFSENAHDSDKFETSDAKMILEEFLSHGLDINVQNSRGQTPIHLAFYRGKEKVIKLLLKQLNKLEKITNVVDDDNLSYLHIACALKDESLVEKLLKNSVPNITYNGRSIDRQFVEPGSTPLHTVAANGSQTIARMLLRRGANLHARDTNGLTPIHWLLKVRSYHLDHEIANVLFASLPFHAEDQVVDGLGLSYLHVASYFGHARTVERLLASGSNVNAVIKYDEYAKNRLTNSALSCYKIYSNFTPLQMAIDQTHDQKVIDLLVRRGADIFVKELNVYRRLSRHYSNRLPIAHEDVLRSFFRNLWEQDNKQEHVEGKYGLTRLHVACYLKDKSAIKFLLHDEEMDVHAQIHEDSPIFPGCTPLHLLTFLTEAECFNSMRCSKLPFIGDMINLLVKKGADVTIANTQKDTPVHVFSRCQMGFSDVDLCKNLLLKAQWNFRVNPVNADGFSHFHLACYWHNVEIVRKFLQHRSVDINQPIDYFAKHNFDYENGSTPLHLALSSRTIREDDWEELLEMVDLLMKHGADVNVKDVHGDTPLHKPAVLKSPGMSIFEKLVSCGGNVTSRNIRGQTPMEVWLDLDQINTNSSRQVQIFQKYGYKINSWNDVTGIGYIAQIFSLNVQRLSSSSIFDKFLLSEDVKTIDNMGRTAIHNSVAVFEKRNSRADIENYIYAIESFVKIGIDIDYQDTLGQTALHYAARMENVTGAKALLVCGADVNIVDNSGKSAFFYAMEHGKIKSNYDFSFEPNFAVDLHLHMKKLQHLRIEVSQHNQNLMIRVQNFFDNTVNRLREDGHNNLSQRFFNQIEKTKTLEVGVDSLTLFDFLHETGAVASYCIWPKPKRELALTFFKYINFKELKELTGIIKLQFKKMSARFELIDSALNSLRMLLGFSVPDLCEQISQFLSYYDLKNVIKSTTLKIRKRKISEIEKYTLGRE